MQTQLQKPLTEVMGGVVWLSQFSKLHSAYSVGMLNERIGRSLELGQYLYSLDGNNMPIGFCCWAMLGKAVLADILETGRAPSWGEWSSGKNLYFVELIAPFGHSLEIMMHLKNNYLATQTFAYATRGEILVDGVQPPKIKTYAFCMG